MIRPPPRPPRSDTLCPDTPLFRSGQGAQDSLVEVDDIAFGGTINTAPLARDVDLSVAEDVSIAFDMLANDEDVDGDPLAVTILTGPVSGTLTDRKSTRLNSSH